MTCNGTVCTVAARVGDTVAVIDNLPFITEVSELKLTKQVKNNISAVRLHLQADSQRLISRTHIKRLNASRSWVP